MLRLILVISLFFIPAYSNSEESSFAHRETKTQVTPEISRERSRVLTSNLPAEIQKEIQSLENEGHDLANIEIWIELLAKREPGLIEIENALQNGADPNALFPEFNSITNIVLALYHVTVSKERRIEVVRLLLDAGADVNAQSGNGDTALMASCFGGHIDIARLLLDAGADIEKIQDKAGNIQSPFHHCEDL